ncbi:molybdenum cofactor biosynthesis protein MoeA [Leptospira perolatii]|uniref:Molybdenum cofactor biosynthesis protein MoeA n=1 Tax=Leptospira perolatii TaxID=2023191 RepID=A0A2M9ZMX1_9LEPT|nr:GTP 3',8-cyclase MoaA [Leptospira perolatii]PJZ70175.1 molybdenum cofactor biosynthesis protein MoeA [Leptospira perolatii]PJZ73395.1 molybdenum cofactor biosynthesis protein MoeA [Leptospira perolatii]
MEERQTLSPGSTRAGTANLQAFPRKFEVLRISVTSTCGFGCVYCAPGTSSEDPSALNTFRESHSAHLSLDLLRRNLTILTSKLNIKEVHLTGGEPTNHKQLPEIVSLVKELGVPEVALTSNGFFPEPLLSKLQAAGLDRMNFSVDSLSQEGFQRISGKKLPVHKLIEKVEQAISLKMNVKVNCTVLRGYNEDQVVPLLKWTGDRGVPIRYLELMRMGPLFSRHQELFYSALEIRDQIGHEFNFEAEDTPLESTAKYYRTTEGYRFGIIGNHTEPFCEGCNRLRMDVKGNIYGCLSDTTSYSLSENEEQVEESLRLAMMSKKNQFTGSELSMKYIGG